MTEKLQIYKCEICGNIVMILHEGADALVCCGEEMKLQEVQYDKSELGEKHYPKTELIDGKTVVNVLSHPMTQEHHIEWIRVYDRDKDELLLKFLKPEVSPKFQILGFTQNITSTEYCNIHGLWGENS